MKVERPPERPLFVWDGDCEFCGWWVRRWMSRLPEGRARAAPYQEVGRRYPEIPEESFRRSAKLILPDGRVLEAAASVFRLLALGDGGGGWALYRRLPPFRRVAEAVYGWIARRRPPAARVTRWLWGPEPGPSTFRLGGWAFRVALGLVYVAAFASLAVQVGGLVGPEGILPAGAYLDAVSRGTGSWLEAVWRAPTLAWFLRGEAALAAMSWAGAAAGLLLAVGLWPLLSAAAAWALYLSLTVAGQEFLAYQWDSLLLEAGFLALFLVPAGGPSAAAGGASTGDADGRAGPGGRRAGRWVDRLRSSLFRAPRPGFGVVWLGAWLLLRLILESGLAKLASGDPTWWDLTALAHHFETQPIPNPVAWFAHRLPTWVHRAGTAGTLLVEVPVPLLLLLPRRPRHLAATLVVLLQLLILLTGNYAFFNVLTVALALLVLDDRAWEGLLGRFRAGRALLDRAAGGDRRPADGGRAPARVRRWLLVPYGALAVLAGAVQVSRTASPDLAPDAAAAVADAVAPLRLVNGYGLFADMTTRRPEIVVEGRRNGGPWRALDFRYKPDAPGEMPPQVAPHQPRLDWQMWFAALRADRAPEAAPARVRYDRWLLRFVSEVLRGNRRVTALLDESSPFRRRPPDAVRARLAEYRFTGWEALSGEGRWWSRSPPGPYLPPVRLGEEGLERAR